jgi:hypothetical protein
MSSFGMQSRPSSAACAVFVAPSLLGALPVVVHLHLSTRLLSSASHTQLPSTVCQCWHHPQSASGLQSLPRSCCCHPQGLRQQPPVPAAAAAGQGVHHHHVQPAVHGHLGQLQLHRHHAVAQGAREAACMCTLLGRAAPTPEPVPVASPCLGARNDTHLTPLQHGLSDSLTPAAARVLMCHAPLLAGDKHLAVPCVPRALPTSPPAPFSPRRSA